MNFNFKKSIIFFLFLIMLTVPIFAQVSLDEKKEIQEQIDFIVSNINDGSLDFLEIISPNADPLLKENIENSLYGQEIYYLQEIKSITSLSENTVEVKGIFSAEGLNWNSSGLSNYFIFEKIDGKWYLLDTNFYERLGGTYIFKLVMKILIIVLPIFLIMFAFWLWMLIDLIGRSFENKALWVVLLIILGILGAILYFFIIRRKFIKYQQKS